MVKNKEWPCKFLGRCASCLNNAYLNFDCNYGLAKDCLIKLVRAASSEKRMIKISVISHEIQYERDIHERSK